MQVRVGRGMLWFSNSVYRGLDWTNGALLTLTNNATAPQPTVPQTGPPFVCTFVSEWVWNESAVLSTAPIFPASNVTRTASCSLKSTSSESALPQPPEPLPPALAVCVWWGHSGHALWAGCLLAALLALLRHRSPELNFVTVCLVNFVIRGRTHGFSTDIATTHFIVTTLTSHYTTMGSS